MKKIIQEDKFDFPYYEIELKDPGLYKYQVYAYFENVKSNTIEGLINFKRPIQMQAFPQKGAVIELDRPDQQVNLNWSKIKNSKNYQIEIAENELFQNPILQTSSVENSVNINLTKTGKYFWRVKAINNDNETDYSEPISVEIRPSPPLKAPSHLPNLKIEIQDSNETSFFKKIFSLFIPLAYAETDSNTKSTKAKWNLTENKKVKSYLIEIYRDRELKELVKKIESNSSQIEWINPESGVFYWRVAYKDYWDRYTEFSPLSQIELIKTPKGITTSTPQKMATQTTKDKNEKKEIKERKIIKKQMEVESQVKKEEVAIINSEVDSKPSFCFFYSPHFHQQEVTENNNQIKIDGMVVNSFKMNSQYKTHEINFEFSRGKVFNDLKFNHINLNYSYFIQYNNFKWGPSLSSFYHSDYFISNQQVNLKNKFLFSIGLKGHFDFKPIQLISSLEYGNTLKISGELQYQFLNQYLIGPFFTMINLDKNENLLYGLNFGMKL